MLVGNCFGYPTTIDYFIKKIVKLLLIKSILIPENIIIEKFSALIIPINFFVSLPHWTVVGVITMMQNFADPWIRIFAGMIT